MEINENRWFSFRKYSPNSPQQPSWGPRKVAFVERLTLQRRTVSAAGTNKTGLYGQAAVGQDRFECTLMILL